MAKTWTNSSGGNWSVGTNWSPNGAPGPTDDAIIDSSLAGSYTVTIDDTESPDAVTLNDANVLLTIASTGILIPNADVNLEAGTLGLAGEIIAGTIVNTGAVLAFKGGTLDGDTWQGSLGQASGFGSVNINDGLTLLDAAGTGPGTLEISGLYVVNILDAIPLSDMTIDFGNFNNEYLNGSGSLPLELTSSVVVTQTADAASGSVSGTELDSAGLIDAESSGGSFYIGSTTFNNTGSLVAGNRDTVTVGLNFNNSGVINISASSAVAVDGNGTADNTGTIIVTTVGTFSSAKDIAGDGTIELSVLGVADVRNVAGTVRFEDGKGTLRLEVPGSFMGTVAGFQKGDKIDLLGEAVTKVTYDSAGKVLLALNGADTVASINLVGNYPTSDYTFGYTPDGATGNYLTVACYASGTAIRTADGDVAVEDLRVGARLPTYFAGGARVKWLGHRRIVCGRHPEPRDVWPVRVARAAFGPGLPRRDLLLSPDHAVFVDGVLIPVKYLINDATIVQEQVAEITYWHVELERHDVIMAENLPCESYLDTGNRAAFANSGGATMLHADFARKIWATDACAELICGGAELVAARSMLLERATELGHGLTSDPDVHLIVGGQVLRPTRLANVYRFRLNGAASARLASRASIPAHDLEDGDDHRALGVAISRIVLDGRPLPLTAPALGTGWHAAEPAWRWTDGYAELALHGARSLEIEVAFTPRYRLPRDGSRQAEAG